MSSLSSLARLVRVCLTGVPAALLAVLMLALGPAAAASAATASTAKPSEPGKSSASSGKKAGQDRTSSREASNGSTSNGEARGTKNQDGNAGTSGDSSEPQPESRADKNTGGANGQCGEEGDGPYCSTRDGSASQNGKGDGKANGKPCAGCVGKADNKNPKGQEPGGSDNNAGYECDRNQGIGKSNPAHTGCTEGESTEDENTDDGTENGTEDGTCTDGESPDAGEQGCDTTEDGTEGGPEDTCPEGQMAAEDGTCEPMTVSPICPMGEMSDTAGDCVEVTESCTSEQQAAGDCRTPCPAGQMDDTEGGCTDVVICENQEQMDEGMMDGEPCVPEAAVIITGSTPDDSESPSSTPGTESSDDADQGVLSSGESRPDAETAAADEQSTANAGVIQRASDAVAGALPNTGAGWAVLIAGLLGVAALVGGWRILRSR